MEAPDNDAPFSAESYFATQPPPAGLEEAIEAVREFVERNLAAGKKVVLITVSEETSVLVTRFNCPRLCRAEGLRCHWNSMCEIPSVRVLSLFTFLQFLFTGRALTNEHLLSLGFGFWIILVQVTMLQDVRRIYVDTRVQVPVVRPQRSTS